VESQRGNAVAGAWFPSVCGRLRKYVERNLEPMNVILSLSKLRLLSAGCAWREGAGVEGLEVSILHVRFDGLSEIKKRFSHARLRRASSLGMVPDENVLECHAAQGLSAWRMAYARPCAMARLLLSARRRMGSRLDWRQGGGPVS